MIKSRRMIWTGLMAFMGEECIQGSSGKTIWKETIRKT
jgi:hypothetical protein